MYKSFDNFDLAYIKSIIDNERVYEKGHISSDFSHDELATLVKYPDVLIFHLIIGRSWTSIFNTGQNTFNRKILS